MSQTGAPSPGDDGSATAGADYAARLRRRSASRWKRALDVQRPYRWNLRRLRLGRTLDVGCGIGRNLHHLDPGSVGVDHNASAVAVARAEGLEAYSTQEFAKLDRGSVGTFDAMLVAHVLEHVSVEVADELLASYQSYLRPAGRIVLITPQEAGYRSDETHVRFVDETGLAEHLRRVGADIERSYSFPFPRAVGRTFTYNEFVAVARTGR